MNTSVLRKLYKDQYVNKVALAPTIGLGAGGAAVGAINGLLGKSLGNVIGGRDTSTDLAKHTGASALAHAIAGVISRFNMGAGMLAHAGAGAYSFWYPLISGIGDRINKK